MSLPVATIISVAKVSQYLAQMDVAKGNLFGERKIPITPQILYVERKAVEWLYNLDPNDTSLRLTANYLYSLCRGYNLQALNIVNSGGSGGISPVAPAVPISPYDFVVSSNSFIATGATSKQFPSSWKGRSIQFFRNFVLQTETVPPFGTYYSWDSTNAILYLLAIAPSGNAAVADENFQIYAA